MRNEFRVSRALAAGLTVLAVAGCSGEFSRDPFASPFQQKPASEVTNTVTPQPTPQVESRPLAQPAYTPSPHATAPRTVPATPAPRISAQPAPVPATTATVPTRTGWTWEGGTAITVQQGETVDILARRYGVPSAEILRANKLASPAQMQPGHRIIIPRYHQAATPAPRTIAPAPTIAKQAIIHTVGPHETLSSISRKYQKRRIEIARANKINEFANLRIGQKLTIPGTIATATKPAPTPRAAVPQLQKPQQRAQTPAAPTNPVENVATVKPAEVAPTPQLSAPAGPPQFRWPVKGKVISAFGPKPNGQHNDGVNVAVPEGTPIKAAEDGTIAYAGNELKGYGNLVLIRHADGWVTAYAHASELLVRRGETVKRGQVIARAGKTGGVDTPQLHFEIRKGSQPMDPSAHLASVN